MDSRASVSSRVCSNVAFYRKPGFEISGQAEFEGYAVYGMIRPPPQPA